MKKITLLSIAGLFQFVLLQAQAVITFNYTGAVQTYTVPPCVTSITIDAYGAQGGSGGGHGANMRGDFAVTPGDVLNIVVGQMGLAQVGGNAQNSAGGGGGSFVYTPANVLFVAAGGGGGKCPYTGSVPLTAQEDGNITLNGSADSDNISPGGINGNGGAVGIFANSWNDGGGGAGWLTPGGNATLGGKNAAGNWAGGNPYCGGGGGGCGGFGGYGGGGGGGNDYGGGGGGGGYSGGGGGNDPDHGGGAGSFNGGTNQVNTGGVQLGNGLVTITENAGAPTPGTITGSPTFCANGSGNYTIVAMPAATNYTWSVPVGAVINSGQGTTSINVTFGVTGGNVSVTADYACGTSLPQTLAVTISATPTVSFTVSPNATVCSGTNVTLTGTGASTYSWSGGITNAVPFVANATTTYTVTGTSGAGCTNTATATITVNTTPTVTFTATPATTVCASTSVTLTGAGASTYSWSGGITDAVPFNATTTTTYSLTGTAANGCTAIVPVTITVNPLPVVSYTANPGTTVCANTNVTLTGTGASTYVWSGGITDAVPFVPSASTMYTVTGTDGNGCSNTAMVMMTVNPLPTIVSAFNPQSPVCTGTLVTPFSTGASTYVWTGGVTEGIPFVGNTTTTYTVTGTDVNGCVNTTTTTLTVSNLSTVSFTVAPSATVCAGTLVTLTGTGAQSYTWSGGITDGSPFVANSSASYTVTGVNSTGCTGTAVATITVNTLPSVTATASDFSVCLTDPIVTLSGTPAGGTWSGSGVIGATFHPTIAGLGTSAAVYAVTNSNGCTDSAWATIVVNACVGIHETTFENGVEVFPNPNSGVFTIAVNANVGEMKIEMFDLQGRVVFASQENNVNAGFTKQISMENVSDGLYMLKLTTATQQQLIKVTVQK